MGSHENQVAAGLFGGVDDGLVGNVAGRGDGTALDSGFSAQILNFTEVFAGLLLSQFGEFLRRGGVDQGAFPEVRDGIFGLGEKGGDPGARFAGEGYCAAYGLPGRMKMVGRRAERPSRNPFRE